MQEAKENKKNKKSREEPPEGGGDDGSVVSMTEEETATTTSSKKRFTAAVKGAGKHKGWSDEGSIQLYNILKRGKLEEQRDNPALNTFESQLKEMFLNNGKGRIASKSKEKRE